MAWTTPLTAVSNAALTAAQWNASVRDNLLETAVAKATTAGSHFAVTAANTLAERLPTVAEVATSETTTSAAYDDLTAGTVGPTITSLASGPRIFACWSSSLACSSAGGETFISWDVTGSYTAGVSDNLALSFESSAAADRMRGSYAFVRAITAGTSTYTLKYKVTAGTATVSARRISILPF